LYEYEYSFGQCLGHSQLSVVSCQELQPMAKPNWKPKRKQQTSDFNVQM